jgi:Ca2+/Na+ antiporter
MRLDYYRAFFAGHIDGGMPLNSNSLNIPVGLCLPALLIGFSRPNPAIISAVIWLFYMKFTAIIAASNRNGLRRIGGAVIVMLYFLFALAIILWK